MRLHNLRALCLQDDTLTILDKAAIVIEKGKIAWIGQADQLPAQYQSIQPVYDAKGALVTPGLIDCHTHAIFGSNRARDFQLRLEGVSYQAIAAQGGGIQSTVRATQAASEEILYQGARARLARMLARGVTTVEIKSGYGLDNATEEKMLRVAQQLSTHLSLTIQKTFLGAHACPPGVAKAAYLQQVTDWLIALHQKGLVDAVDAFCEKIAFSTTELTPLFETARQLRLPIKLHAEQLSQQGAAQFAAQYGAMSADHLEHLDEAGAKAMAQAGTVAVLLPIAFYALRETRHPPIDLLRRHSVPIAIATDCNPGTSPSDDLLLAMHMGCTLWGLTPTEVILGVTRYAARALGMESSIGTLAVGKAADLVIWDVDDPVEIFYWIGHSPCRAVFKNGKGVHHAVT